MKQLPVLLLVVLAYSSPLPTEPVIVAAPAPAVALVATETTTPTSPTATATPKIPEGPTATSTATPMSSPTLTPTATHTLWVPTPHLTPTPRPDNLFPDVIGATDDQIAVLHHAFDIIKECGPELDKYARTAIAKIDILQNESHPAHSDWSEPGAGLVVIPANYYFPYPSYLPQMLLHESWHLTNFSDDEVAARAFGARCPPSRWHP